MAKPDRFTSATPQTYKCLQCGVEVHTTEMIVKDQYGREFALHNPSSEYWNDVGVFCSALCGLNYQKSGPTV